MSRPRVLAVEPGSPAVLAGVEAGDELVALNGVVPRDVLEYQWLADEGDLTLDLDRSGLQLHIEVHKTEGEPLGIRVHSAVFDRVQTCDNRCEFCFIYQLPKGMRRSLYLKDDDYRLSFLYGNFTTLTRFTEADLERVIAEKLSPLHVSIHATDPGVRAEMLQNRRGATSLRWLRALLDHGIEVHGQVVLCPGVNDGTVLDDTLAGVLDEYPELASLCVVPLGVSRYNKSPKLRPHSAAEAGTVLDAVDDWQGVFLRVLGRRLVFAADEYYLMAGRRFPPASSYEGFPMHEDGVGMARCFEQEFFGLTERASGQAGGFFAWVDAAPEEGYRAPRVAGDSEPTVGSGSPDGPVGLLTGVYGAAVLAPLVSTLERDDARVISVVNEFFGGNTAVAGLMVGADIARVLDGEPRGHRYLLPDVCLSQGRFLDGMTPSDLPREVEVVRTDGFALREALDQ